jgi:putative ATPase
MKTDLFEEQLEVRASNRGPLADRMRPRSIEEFIGQDHLMGKGRILQRIIDGGEIPSMIFWGPPGCGKTSLARLLSMTPGYHFTFFSAVLSGVKEVREAIAEAEDHRRFHQRKSILFVDEIHRFNKAQQDAFLPHVESGLVSLIGATTENPSFELTSPLLSRCRVLTLSPLQGPEIVRILKAALTDPDRGLGQEPVRIPDEGLVGLAEHCQGDARVALNALELVVGIVKSREKEKPGSSNGRLVITQELLSEALQSKRLLYDRGGEEHYNIISAFIKSMRGSDPDAALYWLARMLQSGEEPHFILRRMIIFASEDVGNGDPQALGIATSALAAFDAVGLPEGWIPMAQAATYLAAAPKSNASYKGYVEARAAVERHGSLPVPLHLRNAPTPLMKQQHYGQGYLYPHDFEGGYVSQQYLPDQIKESAFYKPTDRGFEEAMRQRLAARRAVPPAEPKIRKQGQAS